MPDIHSWIESLSYESFINALAYSFRSVSRCKGRGEARRQRRREVIDEDLENDELKILHRMLKDGKNYMYRFGEDSVKGSHKCGVDDLPSDLTSMLNLRKVDISGCFCNESVKVTALPLELASILNEAGVHRSMDLLTNEYNAAREESDDETNYTDNEAVLNVCNMYAIDKSTSESNIIVEQRQQDVDSKFLGLLVLSLVNRREDTQKTWHLKIATNVDEIQNTAVSDRKRRRMDNKKQLLESLRIASRGKFLTIPHTTEATMPVHARWFNPQQWFSLASYLVSKLETGLWAEFHRQISKRLICEQNTELYTVPQIFQEIKTLDASRREYVWYNALGLALKILFEEMKNLLTPTVELEHKQSNWAAANFITLKESLIVQLLRSTSFTNKPAQSDQYQPSIPLLLWCTPQSRLKQLVWNNLEESYSTEMQSGLLKMEDLNKACVEKRRKKKKKRVKGCPGSDSIGNIDAREVDGVDNSLTPKNKVQQSDGENNTIYDVDDNDLQIESIVHTNETKTIATSYQKQTLNINNDVKILMLKTIDDILQNVFLKVGLNNATDMEVDDSLHSKCVNIEQTPSDATVKYLKIQGNRLSKSPQISQSTADRSLLPQMRRDKTTIFDGEPFCSSGALDGLSKLEKEATTIDFESRHESPKVEFTHSKESSPPRSPLRISSVITLADRAPLIRNFSRDDIRSIDERRRPHRRDKDHISVERLQLDGNRNVDALLSYRNVVAQSVHRHHLHDNKQKAREEAHPLAPRNVKVPITPKANACTSADFPNSRSSITSSPPFRAEPIINKILHLDLAYARSECALDGTEDASHCRAMISRAHTDDTVTKDGATISSVPSTSSAPSRSAVEQCATVKEERDCYRDHCLMLGAENAKLRNLLASKMCTPIQTQSSFLHDQVNPLFYSPNYSGGSSHPVAAMSDAGIHRYEHDSVQSEDGTDMVGMSITQNSTSWHPHGDSVHSLGRRTSVGGTYAESDMSVEQNTGNHESHMFSPVRHVNHQDSFFGPMPLCGMRSRLSHDIDHFMQALKVQLKRNESRRIMVVEQITKAVNAVWPRAQIKMYGSHMTRLCLPSSDMDFVICLPAVHKNAPARAPGDLEGRNAINETNQKVLARKLKGESWLDQRSLKVIERTAVPVIKVSTKDSRSKVVQLDLSFDAKEHHGLDALNMIRNILEELPVIRPLVLVLKQFLLDRGLLTSYTGGLSSYCLFLMVARYCQEQSSNPSWYDCGSLLIGFLDFYGNYFDPRTSGISVGKRQYFSRSQIIKHIQPLSSQFFNDEQGWNASTHQFNELARRNSFSDRSFGSGSRSGPIPSSRFQMLNRQFSVQGQFHAHAPQSQAHLPHEPMPYPSGKPYTFDPIWVEDPLNPGNNVGRNAFRIFQVQRAFSDAHRALVAALEWDINSVHELGEEGEYPLLKSLLQNEDVFFDIMRD